MENVPNLLTAEKGYFKREIEELFSKMGYILDAGVLNAADYGVPQNRRRAVIIGKKTNEERVNLLPKPVNKKVSVWDAISDLAYLNSGEGDEIQDYKFEARSEYQKKMRMNSNKLLNHKATNHSKLALERLALTRTNGHGLGMWIVNNTCTMSGGEIQKICGEKGFEIEFTIGGKI